MLCMRCPALIRAVLLLPLAAALGACSVGYYGQAALGQLRISLGSQPVERLLADPQLDPALRARLELSQSALEFAHNELGLPDNGSYRAYTETGREAVVWNVFAAPEFSVEPRTWCFPIAGCVAYRGYFSQAAAERFAERRRAAGDDVFVGAVAAYSTLGRLKDPLLNTMLPMSDTAFVGLLFHELAHQRLYVPGDTAFNESYASALERIGLRRWRASRGQPAMLLASAGAGVRTVLLDYRQRLAAEYAVNDDKATLRENKQRLLTELTAAYRELTGGSAAAPYARLFAEGINNAALAAIATYADYVPAFMALYADCERELDCWYAATDALAAAGTEERAARLAALLAPADPDTPAPAAAGSPSESPAAAPAGRE